MSELEEALMARKHPHAIKGFREKYEREPEVVIYDHARKYRELLPMLDELCGAHDTLTSYQWPDAADNITTRIKEALNKSEGSNQ